MYFFMVFFSMLAVFIGSFGSLAILLWLVTKMPPKGAPNGLTLAYLIIAIFIWISLMTATIAALSHPN